MDREKKIQRLIKQFFITLSCRSHSVPLIFISIFIFIFIRQHVLNKVSENNDSKLNHIKGNFIVN